MSIDLRHDNHGSPRKYNPGDVRGTLIMQRMTAGVEDWQPHPTVVSGEASAPEHRCDTRIGQVQNADWRVWHLQRHRLARVRFG